MIAAHRTVLTFVLCLYGMSTLIAMAPMNIGAGLALLCLFILAILDPRFRRSFRPQGNEKVYLGLSVGFVLIATISLVTARAVPLQFLNRHVEIEFFKDISKLWYLFLPFFLGVGFSALTEVGRMRARWAWYGTFGVFSLIGVAQFFTGWPRPQPIPGFEPYFHATLGLGHHLSVASIWIFPFFFLLEEMTSPGKSSRYRWLGWIALFAGAVTLFFTFSRMGWVAFGAAFLLWTLWRFTRNWPRSRKVFAAAALVMFAVGLSQIPPIQNRLHSGMGIQERVDLWQANWEFFKLRPWTGIGFRQTEELAAYYLQEKKGVSDVFTGHAHNNFLEVLSGTGIFGALLWLAVQILIFKSIWSLPGHWRRAFFCAFVAFHINGLTQVNYWEGKVQHQLAWVLAWLFFLRRRGAHGER